MMQVQKLNFFSVSHGIFLSTFVCLVLEGFIASALLPAGGATTYFGHAATLGRKFHILCGARHL